MPCFDKKLEASRSEFFLEKAETREVDCVITSGTVTTLMQLFVCMNVEYLLFYTFHCLIQERFRKCWRRKMWLSTRWNLHRLIQCKFCNFLSFLACLLLDKISHDMNFQKNRWTHTLHVVLGPGSAVCVGMSSWAMLGAGQGVTSIMSSPTLPSICLERRWRSSPSRPSGECVSTASRGSTALWPFVVEAHYASGRTVELSL